MHLTAIARIQRRTYTIGDFSPNHCPTAGCTAVNPMKVWRYSHANNISSNMLSHWVYLHYADGLAAHSGPVYLSSHVTAPPSVRLCPYARKLKLIGGSFRNALAMWQCPYFPSWLMMIANHNSIIPHRIAWCFSRPPNGTSNLIVSDATKRQSDDALSEKKAT